MSLWALLLAAVVIFILGSLWYGPIMFADVRMKGAGLTKSKMQSVSPKKMVWYFVAQFFSGLVMLFVLDVFLHYTMVTSYRDAVIVALLLWLWFVATTAFGAVTWEQKSWGYYFVNVWYYLVSLVLGALILTWL